MLSSDAAAMGSSNRSKAGMLQDPAQQTARQPQRSSLDTTGDDKQPVSVLQLQLFCQVSGGPSA
jgi:hypothetical protein